MLDLLGILDSINVDDADSKHVLILLSKVFFLFLFRGPVKQSASASPPLLKGYLSWPSDVNVPIRPSFHIPTQDFGPGRQACLYTFVICKKLDFLKMVTINGCWWCWLQVLILLRVLTVFLLRRSQAICLCFLSPIDKQDFILPNCPNSCQGPVKQSAPASSPLMRGR